MQGLGADWQAATSSQCKTASSRFAPKRLEKDSILTGNFNPGVLVCGALLVYRRLGPRLRDHATIRASTSAPAQRQELQIKYTSDATSLLLYCCRASVSQTSLPPPPPQRACRMSNSNDPFGSALVRFWEVLKGTCPKGTLEFY